jgi:glutamine amidotransferase
MSPTNTAPVPIVRTGTANLASVVALFARLGKDAIVTADPARVADAPAVVLPGVGTFAAAMETLEAHGLVDVLRARIAADRPTLAICLGLQLLFETSEESPGARGLGLFPGGVVRFGARATGDGSIPPTSQLRVPAIGWNEAEVATAARFLPPHAWFYFAHSYFLPALPRSAPSDVPAPVHAAVTRYGRPYVSAFERGALLACQFHPELSGAAGQALVARWLDAAEAR